MPEINEGAPPHRIKFHLASSYDEFGRRTVEDTPRPSYELGNALHLPDGLTGGWQLRPMVSTDMMPGVIYQPGTWMLLHNWPDLATLYLAVHLPFRMRINGKPDAVEAFKRYRRRHPDVGAYVERMDQLLGEVADESDPSRTT